ncbi:MAG TPA: glutathione S-transferase N-terminal domain-containing protein [Burkholderiaceae bacterium]|nr:glutathione S-transferase N-terminal domain-containing protein [Burkholderiaceae bacterium]
MLTLYTWTTPNGRKISIMLEELELPYHVVPINIGAGEQHRREFVEISPNAKIPALVDSEGPAGRPFAIFESGAILIYLAEKHRRLLPQDPEQRSVTLQWLMFQMGNVGPFFGQRHHFYRQASHEQYGLERYTKETHRLYRVLDARLAASEFLAGDAYTIADIATYPWVARWEWHAIDWATLPNVKRWFDAIGARPAVQRGMAVPKLT